MLSFRGNGAAPSNLQFVGWYIILAIVGIVLLAGWRLDRKDRASKGRSQRASDMTRAAMRYREAFRSSRRR